MFEWSDAVINCSFRGLRGGSWLNVEDTLRSANRSNLSTDDENSFFGFRVAGP